MNDTLPATVALILAGMGPGTFAAEERDVVRAGMETPPGGFRLEEFLGHTWRNEVVRFPLSAAGRAEVDAGHALVDEAGRPIPYQVIAGSGPGDARIAFAIDLDPLQVRTWRFGPVPASRATDLSIEETEKLIRVHNPQVGISIRRSPGEGEGPLEAIRLGSGAWVGGSRLIGLGPPRDFRAEVVVRGPVLAEISCRADFGGRAWRIRFSLQASDPVIEVDEEFALGTGASMAVDLARGFDPDTVLYREGKGAVGTAATWRIGPDAEPAFVLEPWLRWWERSRQGRWFGLFRDGRPDLLAIGAVEASGWVDPRRDRGLRSPPRVLVTSGDRGPVMDLPLGDGRRWWLIAAVDREASLDVLRGENRCRAPLPQRHFVRHGDFPLDLVKDLAIDWPGDHDAHPRLLVARADLPALRRTFPADPARLDAYRRAPVSPYTMDEPVRYWLGTGDAELGLHLGEAAVAWVQGAVNMYLDQDDLLAPGFAPHHQTAVLTALNLADAVLGGDVLPPAVGRRVRAQIAFLGHTVDRPDFWSPERGFSANPNMTTTIAAFRTAAACMLPSHPLAAAWLRHGLEELKENQLDRWSDPDGGWLEAPHYAMVSYDYLVGCFLMVRNAGLGDHLYDPKMRKIIEWFAKISTPPDSRRQGHRHLPPLGNTYLCEPTGEFAVLAYLWRDRDPEFAAQMQWMHRQHGSPESPGIGGFFPTLAGYRTILRDDSIPARPPLYGSELFRETGAVLRTGFPSDRETGLTLIAGKNHDHYDKDSGSVTIWGKGRIVADDFGYYGYVTGDDHSMLVSPAAPDIERMQVVEFGTTPRLDYVRGLKLAWTRQIAFVKDPDPLGPGYFVLRDGVAPPAEATWRIWLTCDRATLDGSTARVEGKEDVDTDIVFAAARAPDLRTETISRTSGSGLFPDGRQGPMTTEQTGIVAAVRAGDEVLAVIYPRLKTGRPPAVSAVAGGKGVRVDTEAGTDYVFLDRDRFAFRDGDLAFEGTAGAIGIRPGSTWLALGSAGKIAAGGRTLEAPAAATDPPGK